MCTSEIAQVRLICQFIRNKPAVWNWRFKVVLFGNLLLITGVSAKMEINLKWDSRWINGKRIPSGLHEIDKLEDSK